MGCRDTRRKQPYIKMERQCNTRLFGLRRIPQRRADMNNPGDAEEALVSPTPLSDIVQQTMAVWHPLTRHLR